MKQRIWVAAIIVLSLATIAGCSKGYESMKSAGDLHITLKAGQYPLTKGDNALSFEVADHTGKAVSDAKVDVRFYMPPMPGMAPMDSTTQAVYKGGAYTVMVNPAMEGGWKIDVTVTQSGKQPVTTTYNVDAR